MEQEDYQKEEINWSYIEFIDNQDVLDLIEKVFLCFYPKFMHVAAFLICFVYYIAIIELFFSFFLWNLIWSLTWRIFFQETNLSEMNNFTWQRQQLWDGEEDFFPSLHSTWPAGLHIAKSSMLYLFLPNISKLYFSCLYDDAFGISCLNGYIKKILMFY